MKEYKNYSIKKLNGFALNVKAKKFYLIQNKKDLQSIHFDKFIVLGSGTNILFLSDIETPIIHFETTDIKVLQENNDEIIISVDAGKNFDEFVQFCVKNNYGGAENLSYIPGTVGASPVQNIGAYAVEVKDIIKSVECFDTKLQKYINLNNKDCKFGYRTSIFKQKNNKRLIITAVNFKLSKTKYKFNTEYEPLKKKLEGKKLTLNLIRNTIIDIRKEKLPEYKDLPNCGSFFKNPIVDKKKITKLKEQFSDIKYFCKENNEYKISSAYLIDKVISKIEKNEKVSVYEKQPLVIVNYSAEKGHIIYNFAKEIQNKVKEVFDLDLEIEVNIYEPTPKSIKFGKM